jgi:hypothetical protein
MTPAEAAEAIAQAKQLRVGASDLTIDDLAEAVVEAVDRAVKPLHDRIAAIESRVAVKSGEV